MSTSPAVTISSLLDNELKRTDNGFRDYSRFHPSEFHECMRKIAYRYYGVEYEDTISPNLQRIFDNGHYVHDRFGSYFERMGVLFGLWRCANPLCSELYGENSEYGILKPDGCDKCQCEAFTYEEITVCDETHWLKGKVDGVLKIGKDMTVIDYKSMHSHQYSQISRPLDKHSIQLKIYLSILKFDYGILLYENKDSQRIKVYEVKRDLEYEGKILKRASYLKEVLENKKLPPRQFEEDDNKCKKCIFNKVCWKK